MMKKQIKAYFKYWLDFYKSDISNYKLVMDKIDELFEVFDNSVSSDIKEQWKKQRRNLLNYDD